jgi:hypothetical protein
MRVTAQFARAASRAMQSRVRMFPNVSSVNMMTPMVLNRPLLSARAALLGR